MGEAVKVLFCQDTVVLAFIYRITSLIRPIVIQLSRESVDDKKVQAIVETIVSARNLLYLLLRVANFD